MGMMSIRRVAQKLLAPVIIVLVVALTVGMFYIGFPLMGKEPTSYKGPSVKVNGKVVSDADFNNYILKAAQQSSQMQQYGMSFSESQIRDAALNLAVQDVAFDQEMKKVGSKISVSDAEVDKLIKKYLPTEEELTQFMEQQGYSNKNDFKKAVKKDIEKQKFISLKARELKIKIPKEQVQGMLEQIDVSHILIGLKDSSGKVVRTPAEALAKANEVYTKASSGGDFTQLAKQYSEDPGSKDKGGSLGPMPLEQFKTGMVKQFVDGALALKPGEISHPVQSDYGYHIIKLNAHTIPTGKELQEKYKEIEDNLLMQQAPTNPAFQDWLQKMLKKAQDSMEILDPGIRAYRLKQEQKWQEAAKAYEKAVKRPYYRSKGDIYIDASNVYLQLKQAKNAIQILKKVPVESQDVADYQIALAKAYQADGQQNLAKQTLNKFSAAHANEANVHEQLKAVFTELKMPEEANKQDQIVKEIEQKDKAMLEKYQQNLNQKSTSPQSNPGTGTSTKPNTETKPSTDTKPSTGTGTQPSASPAT